MGAREELPRRSVHHSKGLVLIPPIRTVLTPLPNASPPFRNPPAPLRDSFPAPFRRRSASELDEVVERSRVRHVRRAQDGPLVKVVRRRNLLESPPEVRDEERGRTGHGGKLVIVDEDDCGRTDQAPEVGEVEEDAVEAMVP